MATDIAKAYVQIIPSAEGIGSGIESVLSGEAQKAGASSGKKFSSSFGGAIGTGLKVAGGAAVTAAAGIAALGKSIVGNAKETAAYGDNVDKLSQKIGISAEAFQEWDYVFSQNGADISILEGGMKKLASTLDDARGGSDSAIETFERLGVSVADLSSMSQEDMFGAVLEALQEMPEGAERTALASDLLGRSAMELGPLLNQTADDTNALKQQAHDLGMVMSNEGVKDAAAFTDSMDNLSRAFAGAKNSITAELLPGLTEITNGMANLVAGNDGATDQLVSGFSMLGESISAAIPSVMTGVSSLVQAIATVAPELVSTLGQAIMQALPSIASTIGGLIPQLAQTIMQMLPQLAQTGFQIISELATSIANALPTLIPMAVQIITQLIQTLIENIPMLLDAAIQIVTGLADGILQAIPVLIQAIPQLITSLINALLSAIPQLIDGAIQLVMMLVQSLPEIIQALIDAIPDIIVAIVSALPTCIGTLIDGAIQLVIALASAWPQIIMALIEAIPQIIVAIVQAFAELGPALADSFSQMLANLGPTFDQLVQFATKTWESIKKVFSVVGTWFKTIFTTAVNNIKNVFNALKTFFSSIWAQIQAIFSNAAAKFTEVGSQIVNGIKSGLSNSWANLKAFLQKACGDLIALAKKILGIASPSKVFAEEVGQWIPAGIAKGIQNGMGVLDDEIQRMTDEALVGTITTSTDAVNSINFVPEAGAIAESKSVVINNNIQVDGAQDAELWTQTFISTLKREARMA